MHSVPVWVLTSAIEIALLGYVLLGTLWWLTWRSRRRLQNQLTAWQQTRETPEAVEAAAAARPPQPLPTTALDTEPLEAVLAAATPVEAREAVSDGSEDDPWSSPDDDLEDVATSAEPSQGFSQARLDDLFASATTPDIEAPYDADPDGIRQDLTALLSDSAAMGQQIATLQEKNQALRQAIATFQTNAEHSAEAGAEPAETKVLLQEMETGLTVLQRTRERLQHELRAHCRTLGLDDDKRGRRLQNARASEGNPAEKAAQKTFGALQAEVVHLQSELAQRTTDFERIQADYNSLLKEYQRIFQQE